MQVSFTGILKAYLSSENSIQTPIERKFAKAKRVEDVLNRKDDFRVYPVNEQMKMLLMAKSSIRDYKEPNSDMGEEYMKQAVINRLIAMVAIFYCTVSDIVAAKQMQKEIKVKELNNQ